MTFPPETRLSLYRTYAQACLAGGIHPELADERAKSMLDLDLAFCRENERQRIADVSATLVGQALDAMITGATMDGTLDVPPLTLSWERSLEMKDGELAPGPKTAVLIVFPDDFNARDYEDAITGAIREKIGADLLDVDWPDYDPIQDYSPQVAFTMTKVWEWPTVNVVTRRAA